jgi:hypothetical protein
MELSERLGTLEAEIQLWAIEGWCHRGVRWLERCWSALYLGARLSEQENLIARPAGGGGGLPLSHMLVSSACRCSTGRMERTVRGSNCKGTTATSRNSDDEQDLSSITTKTSSTGNDACTCRYLALERWERGPEEDDGEDSEELDSADTGPSGECLTKRGAPVTTSGGGGKRRKK